MGEAAATWHLSGLRGRVVTAQQGPGLAWRTCRTVSGCDHRVAHGLVPWLSRRPRGQQHPRINSFPAKLVEGFLSLLAIGKHGKFHGAPQRREKACSLLCDWVAVPVTTSAPGPGQSQGGPDGPAAASPTWGDSAGAQPEPKPQQVGPAGSPVTGTRPSQKRPEADAPEKARATTPLREAWPAGVAQTRGPSTGARLRHVLRRLCLPNPRSLLCPPWHGHGLLGDTAVFLASTSRRLRGAFGGDADVSPSDASSFPCHSV